MLKRIIQNSAIGLLLLMALKNIWASLPFRYLDIDYALIHRDLSLQLLQAHHILNFILGLIMLLLSFNLFKRIRMAWYLEVIAITGSIAVQMLHLHRFTLAFIVADLLILVVLLLSYKDFSRRSQRGSLKVGISYFILAIGIIFINTATGIFILKEKVSGVSSIYDAALHALKLFIFMDTSQLAYKSLVGKLYLDTSLILYWVAIFIGLIALMKPLIYKPMMSQYYKNKARTIVNAHGQNPLAYLALEEDKQYYFSSQVEGLCVYKVVHNVMIICGDMICSKEDGFAMLSELMAFAKENYYSLFFMDVTEAFKELFTQAGFGLTKSGEAACFDLSSYQISGGAGAKMRAAINHATKSGITVEEIYPADGKFEKDVKAMKAISKEWLSGKNAPELSFTIGRDNFNSPMDRRYFVGRDAEQVIQAYIVYNPYLGQKAYMAEVTRRSHDAPRGIMEKINYEAFMKMKSEGILETTLGLSPLYNVDSEGKGSLDEKFFSYIYNHMNHYYDFSGLHRAKEKYAPTHWVPRYYAYYPKPFMPQYAYAIVKAQMPESLLSLILSYFRSKSETSEDNKNAS